MPADSADLILVNANVITLERLRPGAEAIAIKGDRIFLVGSNREIEQARGAGTGIVDCQGKTLIPGFNDAHCHVFSLVRKLLSLDLSPAAVRSISDIKEIIRRKVELTPEGTWISGTDYNEFYLAEKRHPTRWDLDEVALHHPVVLSHRSLHACVLNSLALKLAGITNESDAPEGGLIERDLDNGEPNGLLYEMLGYLHEKVIPSISGEELDRGITQVNQLYLSLGITSIGEATVTNGLEKWQVFHDLKRTGKMASRIYLMPGLAAMKEFKEAGLYTGCGDDFLKVGPLKIMLSETAGNLRPSQEELNLAVLEAVEAEFQIAIHAVERNTVEAAIASLEYSRVHFPRTGTRHRIEHCSECPPELRHRLSHLKAVVVSQPPFVYYSGERYLSQVPEGMQKFLYPFKSLMDCGLVVAGSSDSPVVPNNPLVGIYAAVTRRAESGQLVLAAEAVSALEALEMYTLNAAYATFEETRKGSLVEGKLADILMLSADPLQSPPEELKGILVEMTIIGGKIVWEK
jgi:predicted amidohydrolase YtcJ